MQKYKKMVNSNKNNAALLFFYARDANFLLVGAIYLFSLSRPCRDAGPLVVLSRHCEGSVLLYRVMQGLVPVGTDRQFSSIPLNASSKRRLQTDCIRFSKSEK
jgi:hypothetical protein